MLDGSLGLYLACDSSYILDTITSRVPKNYWKNLPWWQYPLKTDLRRSEVFFKFDLFIDIGWVRQKFITFGRSLSKVLQNNFKKCSGVITSRTW